MSEPIDTTAEEEPGTEVTQRTAPLTLAPAASAADLVLRLDVIRDAMDNAMREGIDYGVIPGTDKPTLLKPGAEKLGVLFQLDVQIVNEQLWGPGDHLTVTARATVFHSPTGTRLGYGEGVCTTKEKKYGKRQQQKTCPDCGNASVIKGKAEYGGGWLCWAKKGGCGAKFHAGDMSIEGQPTGEVENPDLPDMWNTVTKMAEKRARVDAVLAVTGASALFTQDAEDLPRGEDTTPAARPAKPEVMTKSDARQIQAEYLRLGGDDMLMHAVLDQYEVPPLGDLAARVTGMTGKQAKQVLRQLQKSSPGNLS